METLHIGLLSRSFLILCTVISFIQTHSMAFSPQANSTDWSTATGRRILMQTFMGRGVWSGQHGGTPTAVNLSSVDRSCYFFFQVAPHLSSRGWVDPVPDSPLIRKSCSTEKRTRYIWVCSQELGSLDHVISFIVSEMSVRSCSCHGWAFCIWKRRRQIVAVSYISSAWTSSQRGENNVITHLYSRFTKCN
jgi:hypothetical protein